MTLSLRNRITHEVTLAIDPSRVLERECPECDHGIVTSLSAHRCGASCYWHGCDGLGNEVQGTCPRCGGDGTEPACVGCGDTLENCESGARFFGAADSGCAVKVIA